MFIFNILFKSGLSAHCINNNCNINNDTITVLKQEKNYLSRMHYEFYFIKYNTIYNKNITNNINGLKLSELRWEYLFIKTTPEGQ